jgi:hypothetical protein
LADELKRTRTTIGAGGEIVSEEPITAKPAVEEPPQAEIPAVKIEPDPTGAHVPDGPPQLPKCGFCDLDPCFPMVVPFQSGDYRARTFFCPRCRSIFSVQVVQVRG